MTGVEYTLFVSRSKSFEDVDAVIEQIEASATLPDDMQALVVKTCDSFKLPGIRRSSMYNTIRLDRSYALKMFALSRLIEINDEGLAIRKGALKKYRSYLATTAAMAPISSSPTKRTGLPISATRRRRRPSTRRSNTTSTRATSRLPSRRRR